MRPVAQPIAGYPARPRRLKTTEDLRAARRALSARVPGWHVERIGATGFPERVAGPLPADTTTAEARRRWVGQLLSRLSAEYGIATRPVIADGPTGPVVTFEPPSIENPVIQIELGPVPDPWWIAVDAQPGAARLPPGVRERSDAELLAAWGPDWRSREIRVSRSHEGRPCDPHPGDRSCSVAPDTAIECRAMPASISLIRGTLRTSDGVRRIAAWPPALGLVTTPGGMTETSLPTCWDTVTGEAIAPPLCRAIVTPEGRAPFR